MTYYIREQNLEEPEFRGGGGGVQQLREQEIQEECIKLSNNTESFKNVGYKEKNSLLTKRVWRKMRKSTKMGYVQQYVI